VSHLYQGQSPKLPAFQELLKRLSLASHQVAYMGDDVIDLPIMIRVGLSVAVADAHPAVCERADWVTRLGGGKGAARELCDRIMEVQGTLGPALQGYLVLDT
jgi:3-deoxy-D-manno-octulosonate 8-phosphate phosphatase (KDO 8-P phosphatase)